MMQPQEIEVWYVLPALRKELCLDLVAAGLERKKIAELLGISEPAVSQYVKGKRASKFEFSPEFKQRVKTASLDVASQKLNVNAAIQSLCTAFRESKELCNLHHQLGDEIPSNCGVCFEHSSGQKLLKIK